MTEAAINPKAEEYVFETARIGIIFDFVAFFIVPATKKHFEGLMGSSWQKEILDGAEGSPVWFRGRWDMPASLNALIECAESPDVRRRATQVRKIRNAWAHQDQQVERSSSELIDRSCELLKLLDSKVDTNHIRAYCQGIEIASNNKFSKQLELANAELSSANKSFSELHERLNEAVAVYNDRFLQAEERLSECETRLDDTVSESNFFRFAMAISPILIVTLPISLTVRGVWHVLKKLRR